MFKKAKRGIVDQMLVVFIFILVLVVMMVGYFIYALVAPVGLFVLNDANNIIQQTLPSEDNISTYSNLTFGAANSALQTNMEWISYGVLFMMLIAFCFCAFFVRTYPFFIIIWIAFIVVLVFCAIILSYTYNDIKSGDGYLSQAYLSWEGSDFLLSYLPMIIAALGLAGGLILYIVPTKDEQSEVLL